MSTLDEGQQKKLYDCIEISADTDIGQRRSENQDRFGSIFKDSGKILIVADGMGGAKGGAKASQLAINTVKSRLEEAPGLTPEVIRDSVLEANEVIFKNSFSSSELSGMGTTIVLLAFTADKLYIANVGDSRAYRIRDGKCTQLTEDHTLVEELIKAKLIDPSQADNHPVSHMLTRSLGPTSVVDVDCFLDSPGPLQDDYYLMCSDGLYNHVEDEEIAKYVTKYGVENCVKRLIALANRRGGSDNITVSVARVTEDFAMHASDSEVDYNPVSERSLIPIYYREDNYEKNVESYENILVSLQDRPRKSKKQEISKYFFQSLVTMVAMVCFYFAYLILSPSDSSKKIVQAKSQPRQSMQQWVPDTGSTLGRSVENKTEDASVATVNFEIYSKLIPMTKKYLSAMEDPVSMETLLGSETLINQEYLRLDRQISQDRAAVESLNQQLSRWYTLKKKFESEGAMKLSVELAAVSERIKSKKSKFEEVSWEYLQKLEDSKQSPNDTSLKSEADQLLLDRKSQMKDLELSIYTLIQEQIDKVNQTVAELVTNIAGYNKKQALSSHELELISIMKQRTPENVTQIQNQLLKDVERYRDNLEG